MAAHPITIVIVWLVTACGASTKDLQAARTSAYDADFAIVYNAALSATSELYPQLNDSPGPGLIATEWQPVSFANTDDDLANQRAIAGGVPGPRVVSKKYFIRFDVAVVGKRPFRVKIVGHASELEPGNALPTELTGVSRPHWLDGRTDALTLAIHDKIKTYAVPVKEEIVTADGEVRESTDPKTFTHVPAGAATLLAKLQDALVQRDITALRGLLADDVAWSAGGSPGAETALATWQADGEALEVMARVLESCAGSERRIACPATPVKGAYQLVVELRGAWKVTSFVKSE